MPPRKFNKKTATTFNLVHRAQNDPLINDENAPSMVFAEKQSQQPRRPTEDDYAYSSAGSVISGASSYRSKKVKQRGDLEDEFGMAIRSNEGEAAEHGVFFDDSEYDYMQHMRDLGGAEGPVVWVEAKAEKEKQKKGKGRLEDALRDMDIRSTASGQFDDAQSVGTQSSAARSLLPEDVLPSEFVMSQARTYQNQQDVPDDIAGFQPDMDPRLREVLEALDDEAYAEDDEGEDDFFAELTGDGYEVEHDEWDRLGEQQMAFDEEAGEGGLPQDEEGWESDSTIRASSPPPPQVHSQNESAASIPHEDAPPAADPTDGAWLDEFKKFKSASKPLQKPSEPGKMRAPSTLESSALSSLASGRRKKRKGAKTSTTNYSMTSSALARTAQQTLLDSRFDKIEEEYAADDGEFEDGQFDDALSTASGATGLSRASGLSKVSGVSSYSRASDAEAPQLQRADFDGIMDEFLAGHGKVGKQRRVRRGAPQSGMEQLDEVRKGLGPARVKSRAAGV